MEEKGEKRSGDSTAKLADPSKVCVLENFNSISRGKVYTQHDLLLYKQARYLVAIIAKMMFF